MAPKNPQTTKIEVLEDKPIIFVGQPDRLSSNLRLQNPGSQPITLDNISLIAEERSPLVKQIRDDIVPQIRLRPKTLRPGYSGTTKLKLQLDVHTPPGEYKAQIKVGDTLKPAVVHITERVALRIRPSSIIVENQPEHDQTKRIIVTNLGNVPLAIGEIGAVYLDDDLLYCRTMRAAAAAVGDDIRSFEEYLAQILFSAREVALSSGILRVRNVNGPLEIAPGETRPVDLLINVPPGLDRRGRFRGIAAVYTADLTFVIVPTSGPKVSAADQSLK